MKLDKEKFEKILKEFYEIKDKEFRDKWKRSLPFFEEIFDRWERASSLGFKEKSNIYHLSYVYGDVKVGKNTWIGPFTILDGTGGLEIGKFCNISAGAQIYTHDSVKWCISGGKYKYEYAPVKIGDCCYIGPLTVITKGVEIGTHSIIGAMSFVNKSIPPYSVAFGIPAKVVGKIEINNQGIKFIYVNKK